MLCVVARINMDNNVFSVIASVKDLGLPVEEKFLVNFSHDLNRAKGFGYCKPIVVIRNILARYH